MVASSACWSEKRASAADNLSQLIRPESFQLQPELHAVSEDFREDVANVFSRVEVTRRRVIKTGLATGFALAVQPVAQATITTSDEGLVAGEVKVRTADIEIPAYRAMPAKGGPFPVALVVQEIFGVHEHIKDICRRFARLGYFAIAPELYVRQGDVSSLQSFDDILKVVRQVPDAQVMSDLDATFEFAKESGEGDVAKLGIISFILIFCGNPRSSPVRNSLRLPGVCGQ